MKTVMKVVKGSKARSLFTLALVSILMTACGKNSDSGNNNNGIVGPYGYAACASCGPMTQPFVTTYGDDRYPEALALQLYSAPTGNGERSSFGMVI